MHVIDPQQMMPQGVPELIGRNVVHWAVAYRQLDYCAFAGEYGQAKECRTRNVAANSSDRQPVVFCAIDDIIGNQQVKLEDYDLILNLTR